MQHQWHTVNRRVKIVIVSHQACETLVYGAERQMCEKKAGKTEW